VVQNAIDVDVWKEIAINKQMLIRVATDALNLDPECSEEDFKAALDQGLHEIATADTKVAAAKAEIQDNIDDLTTRLEAAEKSLKTRNAELETANKEIEKLKTVIEADRKLAADELQKLKSQVDEKAKALKAITTELGDTPANVAKKIKALNKKKHEDNTAKKRIEDELKNVKKERTEKTKKADAKETQAKAILKGYQALQTYCDEQYNKLKELVEDSKTLASPPKLNEDLYADLEST
jgi:colicin import membrane protein